MHYIWSRRNPPYFISKCATNSARGLNGDGGPIAVKDAYVARAIRERVAVLVPTTIGPSACSLSLDSFSGSSSFKVGGAKVELR